MNESIKTNSKEIRNKILSMILPITMENILQMLAGFVSMAMIGRIDAIAVGALGISQRLTQIVWALFKGVTTGASVFVAQAYGANNIKKLKSVVQQTLLSTIVLVIIFQQIIFWKASSLLSIFNPSTELMASATSYLKIVSWGLPFLAISLVVTGVLQGMGNAKTPMKIAFIMNIVNIACGFVFIFGKFGLPALGLKGAALATVIAQATAALLGLYVLFDKNGVLGTMYNKSFFELDFKEIFSVYKVGMPSAFESIFWQISAIILTKIILSFGETALAAYQLGLQAESISYMPAAGFGIAATAFIGQALGSKNKTLGKIYFRELIKGTLLITIFTAGILIFFPGGVMRLLTDDLEVIKIGSVYLVIMGLVQIPQNISGVLNGALRGAGFTRVPMIVAGVGIWGIRIPFALLMTNYFKLDIKAIWIVLGVDLICRFLLSLMLYKTRNIYEQELIIEAKTSHSNI
ncbi:putative multidrug resistance protein norM Multidrug-efflux transporter [Proteiniborus sp. DW1]|uniref:MATE family efflux transporter n=1 Tax=Proteiniborus sp. DW1 TaxID=1889883 RepID=UPI00092E0B39|nr:MATE family efflux transporter [Proteiniborus sp. DW1]SCG83192.1 putative multidrug resistance protein norM Multidrug-efflux transporter [Proteiniborus sp. DW1]